MFERQLKFKDGAVKAERRFAFLPKKIDGGARQIWLMLYWDLSVRETGYLNWDMPDVFTPVGSYSDNGKKLKMESLKRADAKHHWSTEDVNFMPSFLKPL